MGLRKNTRVKGPQHFLGLMPREVKAFFRKHKVDRVSVPLKEEGLAGVI